MTELTVYFKKPADWANSIYIHYWDTRPGGSGVDWPGAPMVAMDDGWFVYRFNGIEAASLIFNDCQGWQTSDLRRESPGFFMNGRWYDQQPDASIDPLDCPDDDPPMDASPQTALIPPPREPIDPNGPLGDFREETIYFLLTARFYEGDPQHQLLLPRPHQIQPGHWPTGRSALARRLQGSDSTAGLHPRPRFHRDLDHAAGGKSQRSRLPRLPRLRLDAH
jgi:hypothetical protein